MNQTNHNMTPSAIVVFDIDGVIRDVTGSHFRAISHTVKHLTQGCYQPIQEDIDALQSEGVWNNDYEASLELIYRYYENQGICRDTVVIDYPSLVNFFEKSYWGDDSSQSLGYISEEKLLVKRDYFDSLTQGGILWGFFSGATRLSAKYVLEKRLGLTSPLLFTVEDGPGKPDPRGLFSVVQQLENSNQIQIKLPVIFVGDTVAEQETINRAKKIDLKRNWLGVGVLPPHVQKSHQKLKSYANRLFQAGAKEIISSIEYLTSEKIFDLFYNFDSRDIQNLK